MPQISREVIITTTAQLAEGERIEHKLGLRTTLVITRAQLEEWPGEDGRWAFSAYGYRKEGSDLAAGNLDSRGTHYSSRSGAPLPPELQGLFRQMRDAITVAGS